MTLTELTKALEQGKLIARRGWNGKKALTNRDGNITVVWVDNKQSLNYGLYQLRLTDLKMRDWFIIR